MTISSRSILVLAPVLGVNSFSPAFQHMFEVLADVCEGCRDDYTAQCETNGCPRRDFDVNEAQLSLLLANSPLLSAPTIESVKKHYPCIDQGNCTLSEESNNNMETVRTGLTKLFESFDGGEADPDNMDTVNTGLRIVTDGEFTTASSSVRAPAEVSVQQTILDNFELWLDAIDSYVAPTTTTTTTANGDTFEPLTIQEFTEFLSVLYSFDFNVSDPTEADIKKMMRWIDGYLDACHGYFFESQKGKDDDDDDDLLNGLTKKNFTERATLNTFAKAAA